jgi:glucan phosphorylase
LNATNGVQPTIKKREAIRCLKGIYFISIKLTSFSTLPWVQDKFELHQQQPTKRKEKKKKKVEKKKPKLLKPLKKIEK